MVLIFGNKLTNSGRKKNPLYEGHFGVIFSSKNEVHMKINIKKRKLTLRKIGFFNSTKLSSYLE